MAKLSTEGADMVSRQERLIVASEMRLLDFVRDFVLNFVRQSSLPNDFENRLVLAVDEAVTNVIEHAYKLQISGYVDIQASSDEDKVSFVITDNGKSFNPQIIKPPNVEDFIKAHRKRGLGIFLMRQIMDEVKYTFKDGQNRLYLVKYINKVQKPK